jgi:hypothetical protein
MYVTMIEIVVLRARRPFECWWGPPRLTSWQSEHRLFLLLGWPRYELIVCDGNGDVDLATVPSVSKPL